MYTTLVEEKRLTSLKKAALIRKENAIRQINGKIEFLEATRRLKICTSGLKISWNLHGMNYILDKQIYITWASLDYFQCDRFNNTDVGWKQYQVKLTFSGSQSVDNCAELWELKSSK